MNIGTIPIWYEPTGDIFKVKADSDDVPGQLVAKGTVSDIGLDKKNDKGNGIKEDAVVSPWIPKN